MKWSPTIYTEQLFDGSSNLQAQQLLWGLRYSGYATHIGEKDSFEPHGIFFIDETGQDIISKEQITEENISYITILKLFVKYPLDIIGIYFRHFIYVITPLYLDIYISNLYVDKGLYISLAIALWIVYGINALFNISAVDKNSIYKDIVIFSSLIPAFLQVAGAVEHRFFISGYFLMYYYLINVIDYKSLWNKVKGNILVISVLVILIYVFWISIVGGF